MPPGAVTAIILPPAGGEWELAAQRVAGLPLLSRTLLSAERAGIRRLIICAGDPAPWLQALVTSLPLKSHLQWIGASGAELAQLLRETGDSPCFLIRATTLLTPAVFTELTARLNRGARIIVPAGQGPDGPVVLGAAELLTDGRGFREEVPLSGDALSLDMATAGFKAAEAALYSTLGKSTDSWGIRWSRRLLTPALRWLVGTPLTPNQITLFGFLIGLGAIACLWQGDYLWAVTGAFLFVVACLVDLLDGMLARLRFQESRWGRWMDYTLDNLVHLGIFGAIVKAVHITQPEPLVLILGGLLIAGAVISAFVIAPQMVHPPRQPNRLLTELMHRDFSLLVLLAAVADRLEWFLWVAAIGSNLFWAVALYLVRRERRAGAGSRAAPSRSK